MKNLFFFSAFIFSLFMVGCQKAEEQDLATDEIEIVEPTKEEGSITNEVTTRAQPCGCTVQLTKMSSGTATIKVCGENINQGAGTQCNSTPPTSGVCSSANNPNYQGSPLSTAANYNLPNGPAAINFCAGDGDDDFKFSHNGLDGAQYRITIGTTNYSLVMNNGQTAYVTKTDACDFPMPCIQ